MATTDTLHIEVVYPLPHEQLIMTAQVPDGILEHYPELTLDTLEAGVFGKLAKLDAPLRERDRIEIYRPLIADPKAVRKQRAAEGKNMKKGGGDADSTGDS